ncbi:hypothetical protein J4441_00340 [Candidatus Micrarchaeota archaeon]|nr:hypothetical protein [Candidatus Micrarchaeota archaeon]
MKRTKRSKASTVAPLHAKLQRNSHVDWKTISIALMLVLLLIFFFPKYAGTGSATLCVKGMDCKCLGFEHTEQYFGPWRTTCFGIPYSCREYFS